MSVFKSLSHSRWDCKYHVVFIPKGQGNDKLLLSGFGGVAGFLVDISALFSRMQAR